MRVYCWDALSCPYCVKFLLGLDGQNYKVVALVAETSERILKQADIMSRSVGLLIFAVTLVVLQSAGQNAFAAQVQSISVTLYAHAPSSGELGSGPILNATPQWGAQQAARIREETVFTLDPPLGSRLDVSGTWIIHLYLRADNRLSGGLSIYLTENTSDAKTRPIQPGFNNTPVFLGTRAQDQPFGFNLNNVTLQKGSTIQLHVKLSTSDTVTGAYLLYDSPTTPTQITIPTRGATAAEIDFLTGSGESARIFETAGESANASIATRISVTDAFGLYRLNTATLQVIDSSSSVLFSISDFLGAARKLNDYALAFNTTLKAPAGVYTLGLTITDRGVPSPNPYIATEKFYVAVYYETSIRIVDSTGRPIEGAQLFTNSLLLNCSSQTNKTGWASLRLPASEIVGPYDLTVSWKNITQPSVPISVSSTTAFPIVFEAFDLSIKVRLLWFDLPGVRVDLLSGSRAVSSGVTNSSGSVIFTQIPPGHYAADVQYLGVAFGSNLTIDHSTSTTIQVPIPYQAQLPYVAIPIIGLAATAVVMRRRKIYESPFDYFDVLTKGGLPDSCTTTIAGSSGSGKTVLMISLAHQTLKAERGCVFVTNVELPTNTRTTMKALGMDMSDYEERGKLIFIDCYSALSGTSSKEKKALASITDLTGLGILITASIEEIRGIGDVYFDSLTPLFTTLKSDYVVSFLQSMGAKVKSNHGRLCATIGTTLDKEAISKVEETSDCVIETQLVETRSGQRRRLRIKKLRGHPYVDTWTRFKISGERGISFLTNKPYNSRRQQTEG